MNTALSIFGNNEERAADMCKTCNVILTDDNWTRTYTGERECDKCSSERNAQSREVGRIIDEVGTTPGTSDDRYGRVVNITDRAIFGIPPLYQDVPAIMEYKGLDKKNVLIFGDFGTGKTYTGYSYLKYFYMRTYFGGSSHSNVNGMITHSSFPKMERAFSIMRTLKAAIPSGKMDKVFNDYITYSLLIIDEYGKNLGSDFEEANLFEIINTRHENNKPTIIIVNATVKADLIKLIRPDILDRFRGGIVEINGKSRRRNT